MQARKRPRDNSNAPRSTAIDAILALCTVSARGWRRTYCWHLTYTYIYRCVIWACARLSHYYIYRSPNSLRFLRSFSTHSARPGRDPSFLNWTTMSGIGLPRAAPPLNICAFSYVCFFISLPPSIYMYTCIRFLPFVRPSSFFPSFLSFSPNVAMIPAHVYAT